MLVLNDLVEILSEADKDMLIRRYKEILQSGTVKFRLHAIYNLPVREL